MIIPRHGVWILVSLLISFLLYFLFRELVFVCGRYPVYVKYAIDYAPFIEEIFKLEAIIFSPECGVFYTTIFSVNELFMYLSLAHNKLPFSYIFPVRIICISLHYALLALQLYGFKKYQETKDSFWVVVAFIVAVFIHLLWNNGLGFWFISCLGLSL